MNGVIFDLETGGLELSHPIIQFAGIALDGDWNEIETLELKIRFREEDATPEALKLNHYDPEVWSRVAVDRAFATASIGSFLNRHRSITMVSKRTGKPYTVARLCGYNASVFDAPRLQKMFRDIDQFLPADPRVRDRLQLAIEYFDKRGIEVGRGIENFKLGTVCDYFGIKTPEGESAHDALVDVRMTAQLHRLLREAA